jgi:hypothetical protein
MAYHARGAEVRRQEAILRRQEADIRRLEALVRDLETAGGDIETARTQDQRAAAFSLAQAEVRLTVAENALREARAALVLAREELAELREAREELDRARSELYAHEFRSEEQDFELRALRAQLRAPDALAVLVGLAERPLPGSLADVTQARGHATVLVQRITAQVADMRADVDRREAAAAQLNGKRDAAEASAPDAFKCSITGFVMLDPVFPPTSGHSYEREAIAQWYATCLARRLPLTDPKTSLRVPDATLTPNHNLRATIEDFVASMPAPDAPRAAKRARFDATDEAFDAEF